MSEQAYPTREQAALLASNTCKIEGCYDCTAIKWCGDETINIMAYGQSILAMHDALDAKQAEIDRLRALVPKTIKPTIPTQDECSAPVICECGWIVAHTDEYGSEVLNTPDNYQRSSFCGQCGAVMDYSELDARLSEEYSVKMAEFKEE